MSSKIMLTEPQCNYSNGEPQQTKGYYLRNKQSSININSDSSRKRELDSKLSHSLYVPSKSLKSTDQQSVHRKIWEAVVIPTSTLESIKNPPPESDISYLDSKLLQEILTVHTINKHKN